jgi:hypothetical protein
MSADLYDAHSQGLHEGATCACTRAHTRVGIQYMPLTEIERERERLVKRETF